LIVVNEIFQTIQGEAAYTGTASIFIRLQGCPVGCAWCDTKHTWDYEGEKVDNIIAKESDSDTYQSFPEVELLELVRTNYTAKHIVITGGEPCIHDLRLFTELLLDADYTVQIETSGTFDIRCHDNCFVTVSPKYDMAGGLPVLGTALKRANEIKLPVGKAKDLEVIGKIKESTNVQIWLQPLSQNKKSTELCIKTCYEYGYKLSIQTHKYIGVR